MFSCFRVLILSGLFLSCAVWASGRSSPLDCNHLLEPSKRIEFSRAYQELWRILISDLGERTQRNRDILLQIRKGFFGFSLSRLSSTWDNMQGVGSEPYAKAENAFRHAVYDNFSSFFNYENFTNAPKMTVPEFEKSLFKPAYGFFLAQLGWSESEIFMHEVFSRAFKSPRSDSPIDRALKSFIESDQELTIAIDEILRPLNPGLADHVKNKRELSLFDLLPYKNPDYIREGREGRAAGIKFQRNQLRRPQE